MIDSVQATLLLVIVVLTVLLIVLGVQVFFVLKDLRTTITKANKILDDTETITESVSEPISFLSALLLGSRSFQAIAKLLKMKKGKKEE